MIAINLEYPLSVDVFYYGLPLPENICTKNSCILLFRDTSEYSIYLNMICDLIDEAEYSLFFHNNSKNIEKIKFCKRYMVRLINAKIPLDGTFS